MKHIDNSSLYIISSLIITTLVSGLVLSSTYVSADNDSTVDEVNIAVPVSCTLSGTGQNSHNAEINNGQYDSAIGETTIKAFCNDNNGFAIYAIGFTDNEDGKNVLTNTTLGSTHGIVTGTAISGDTSNWAMKIGTITSPTPTYPIIIAGSNDDAEKEQGDPDYSTFQEVPDDYAKVAYRTSSTDIGTNAEGATLTTTYQAYISPTQSAGTYTGQVKYVLVHPHDAATPEKPISIDTASTLQDVTYCADSLNENQVYTLIDSRDNQQYKVAKLADGNCWILENLRLDPTDPTTASNMDETNTNASSAAIRNYLVGGNEDNTSGWSSVAVANVDSDFNSYTEPMINKASMNTFVTAYGSAAENGQAKAGIYYNYCAATVGTYCYRNGGIDVPNTGMDANQDICPANWRMPIGGYQENSDNVGLSEYYDLGIALGLTDDYGAFDGDTYQTAFSASLASYFYDNNADGQGELGYWWSSTYCGYQDMWKLYADSDYVDVDGSNDRSLGLSIRCLLKTN